MNIDVKLVRDALGDQYNEIKNFFKMVLTINCPRKILLTRRSYVLCKIFESILDEEYSQIGERLNIVGEIYNTHSLGQIPSDCKDKILVIDDIIVNGRTVRDVIYKLEKRNIKQISVWCIKCNCQAKYLHFLQSYLKHVEYVMPFEWEQLSDRLTRVVIGSFIGYISYVNSYKIRNIPLSRIKNEIVGSNLRWLDNPSDFFDSYSIKSVIVWGELLEPAIVEKYRIKACIRIYEKETENGLLIIPYVFMPSLYIKEVYSYCRNLLDSLGIDFPHGFDCDTIDDDGAVSLYKLTTCKISEKVLNDFLSKYSIDDYEDWFVCNESYRAISKQEKKSNIQCNNNLNVNEIFAINTWNDGIRFCQKALFDSMCEGEPFETTFGRYICKMRKADEEADVRYPGLPIFDMTCECNVLHSSQENVLSAIISSWDCGKAAFVVELHEFDGKKIVSGLVRHGEQSFKEYFRLHRNVYEVFYQFFVRTRDVRENKVFEMAKYFDQKCSTSMFGDFAEGIYYKSYFADLMAVDPCNISSKCTLLEDVNKAIENYVMNYYNV